MALFSEAHRKPTRESFLLSRIAQQALLVPEASILLGLLLIAWVFNFPPLIGILAIVTAFVFGLRLGLMTLAEQQLAQGAYERADRLVQAALRLNPWSVDALVLRAQGLVQQGDDEAAEALLRRAARIYPNDPAIQSGLATVILAQGRIAEGAQLARLDDAADIQLPQVIQQRAWIALHVEENAAKARTLILSADPSRFPPRIALPLLMTLGEAQISLGARDAAEAVLQTIEAELPACPRSQQAELLYHLGRLRAALGESCTVYFRRSVELDPEGRYAQSAWRSAVNG
ncbi:MAG TPA: tetratricopeptide repeat protein [Herpetosiphonaceae bacterium]